MKMNFAAPFEKKSEGSVLVVAVMALVILTLIGLAATTTSNLEQGMAANDVCIKMAFYATESGLNVSEHIIGYYYAEVQMPTGARVGFESLLNAKKMASYNKRTGAPPPKSDITVTLPDSTMVVTYETSGVTIADGTQDEWTQDGSIPASHFRPFVFVSNGTGQCGSTYTIEAHSNIFIPKGTERN